MFLLLFCLSVLWHSNQFQINKPLDMDRMFQAYGNGMFHRRFILLANMGEFTPKTAAHARPASPRGKETPLLQLGSPGSVQELEGNSRHRIHVRVIHDGPSNALINQIYFPGWKVIRDGKEISREELESHLTKDGRMLVALPSAESNMIEAFYEGPPYWRVRDTVIWLFLVGFGVFCFYDKNIQRGVTPYEIG